MAKIIDQNQTNEKNDLTGTRSCPDLPTYAGVWLDFGIAATSEVDKSVWTM